MFISSTAYLPSSFSMYCVMVSTGAWLSGNLPLAVFAIAMATIIGWPFAAALGLPLAVDIIVCKKDVWGFIRWSCLSAVATLVPTAVIDYYFYRKFVVASMNIVLYNVFGKGGPELYGVEPWTYYFVNGFLNFNIVFLLGMMSAVIWVIHLVSVRRQKSVSDGVTSASWKCLAPLYIWIAIFFTRPHKEERFLFPVYPLICLAAAVSLHNLLEVLDKVGRAWQLLRPFLSSLRVVKYAVVTMFVLLSISRSLALFKGYHAPLELYGQLYKHTQTTQLSQNRPYNVCIGKEWYRFTSNFFVHSDRIQVQFIRSSFRGQLPKHYGHATWIMPSEMNDMNREEPGRYVDVSKCQYIVDWDNRAASVDEPNYSLATTEWKVVASAPFLDAGRSSSLYRAFYVPGLSEDTTVYGSYNLLQQITAQ
ncbi:alpha-1,2-mannosyltransferase ALG9-like isoform X2 [Corticium candelabrum]|nr:alpha-1,2-mannosyltransferase ALG9-like isoform X2 [Corticium candelabrum]